MPKATKFSESQLSEVMLQLTKTTNVRIYKKLQVVQLRISGYSNPKVSEITGYSVSQICRLVSEYLKRGLTGFMSENRKGGNRRNMSVEEESSLLSDFLTESEKGRIITVEEIKTKYETACGHPIGSGTIYKVLARHGWRKVMPRSEHPKKASTEAIAASKKLTQYVENF